MGRERVQCNREGEKYNGDWSYWQVGQGWQEIALYDNSRSSKFVPLLPATPARFVVYGKDLAAIGP